MIAFSRSRYITLTISTIMVLLSVLSLVLFRLNPGIDFTGGTEIMIQTSLDQQRIREAILTPSPETEMPADDEALAENEMNDDGAQAREVLNDDGELNTATAPFIPNEEDLQVRSLQPNQWGVRMQAVSQLELDEVLARLEKQDAAIVVLQSQTVGPLVGEEVLVKAGWAIGLAAIGILLLIASRFSELRFGVSAVIAMLHDSIIVLGVFSALGAWLAVEVDLLFVTAILTVMSFSVHDTIVVFDRIRELRAEKLGRPFAYLVDLALTQNFTRSINNSLTMIFMLIVLWLLGGDSIRWFVFALLLGTVIGTYSSAFVATPVLIVWGERVGRKR